MMAAAPWLSEQAVMHGWAMATAAVVSAGCALVGTLLVVRRMSLLGDAISHAVLPGIVVAVLAGGRMGGPIVLVGATATALATVWLTRSLSGRHGVAEDAAAGIVFTTFFAAGVVLVTALASRVDLDASCVLHGILELVPFDTVRIAGLEVPRISRKIPAARVARAVCRAIRRRRSEVVVPWNILPLWWIDVLSPRLADWLVRALALDGRLRA